jgi:hypothetical protein
LGNPNGGGQLAEQLALPPETIGLDADTQTRSPAGQALLGTERLAGFRIEILQRNNGGLDKSNGQVLAVIPFHLVADRQGTADGTEQPLQNQQLIVSYS